MYIDSCLIHTRRTGRSWLIVPLEKGLDRGAIHVISGDERTHRSRSHVCWAARHCTATLHSEVRRGSAVAALQESEIVIIVIVEAVCVWLERWATTSYAFVASAGSFANAATPNPPQSMSISALLYDNPELLQHICDSLVSQDGGTIVEPLKRVNKNFTICDASFTFPT